MAKAASKKKFIRFIVGSGLIAAFLFTAYIAYLWFQTKESDFVSYPEFGIPIPQPYEIHGIDVSKYQQSISWEAV